MGTAARFWLLLGLRYRLMINSFTGKPGRAALAVFGLLALLGWGFVSGLSTYKLFEFHEEHWQTGVRAIFLSIFILQVTFGVVFIAAGDFFDTGRLQHLPVGPREIFGAMSVSSILHPAMLPFAAPAVSFVVLMGGSGPQVAGRVAVVVALVALGQITALALSFVMLSLYSRRRLRDAATILSSLAGLGAYALLRGLGTGKSEVIFSALDSPLWSRLGWLPTTWFADVFVRIEGVPADYYRPLAGVLAALLTAIAGGAASFRRFYSTAGENGDHGDAVKEGTGWAFRWLPGDIAEIARQTLAVIWREPQLKALLLQQHVFLLAPILLNMRGHGSADETSWMLIPVVIVFAHAWLALSMFGFDAGGLKLLFQAPVSRTRLVFARVAGIGTLLGAVDGFVTLLTVLLLGALSGHFQGLFARWGATFGLTVIADLVLLSCGAVVSAVMPVPLLRPGKARGVRTRQDGCAVAIGRSVAVLPVLALTAVVGGIAIVPRLFGLDPIWYLLTIPFCVALVGAVVFAGVVWAGHLVQSREDRILAAMADTGD